MPPTGTGKRGKGMKMDKDMDPPSDAEKVYDEEDDDSKMSANEVIVQFFSDHPYFFDVSHEDYKNTKKKEAEVAQFAKNIGWSPEAVMKRWKNLRTDYGKLRKVLGKSGQGAKKMSSLQQWKLMALAFLDKHIQRRGSGQIGRGAEEEDMDEVSSNDDTESVASMSMWPSSVKRERCRSRSPTTSSGVEVKKKKIEKQQQQRDVSEVLVDILEYNRKKDLEVEKKVKSRLAKQPTEREMYAAWLSSVAMQIPNVLFRLFQSESFDLCMRYLPELQDGPNTTFPGVHARTVPTPATTAMAATSTAT